jgi:hypothetical protein
MSTARFPTKWSTKCKNPAADPCGPTTQPGCGMKEVLHGKTGSGSLIDEALTPAIFHWATFACRRRRWNWNALKKTCWNECRKALRVMQEAIDYGLTGIRSTGGLVGGDGLKLKQRLALKGEQDERQAAGPFLPKPPLMRWPPMKPTPPWAGSAPPPLLAPAGYFRRFCLPSLKNATFPPDDLAIALVWPE